MNNLSTCYTGGTTDSIALPQINMTILFWAGVNGAGLHLKRLPHIV